MSLGRDSSAQLSTAFYSVKPTNVLKLESRKWWYNWAIFECSAKLGLAISTRLLLFYSYFNVFDNDKGVSGYIGINYESYLNRPQIIRY